MSIYNNIKAIAETVTGYSVTIDTSNGANIETDNLSFPAIVIILQQAGSYNVQNSHYRDSVRARIVLFNKTTQDFTHDEVDPIKEQLKSDMVVLYHRLKNYFDFSINSTSLSYEIAYDETDANLVGVFFSDTISQVNGLNLSCDDVAGIPTPQSFPTFCEKVSSCAIIQQMLTDIEALQQGGGGGGLNCNDLANCQTIIDLQAADSGLQTAINNEITARGDADSDLQNQINQEITDRQTADSGLQTAIDNHLSDVGNPHSVTLEQARTENNQIAGNIDANTHQIDNLSNATQQQQAATLNQLEAAEQSAKDYADYLVQSNIKIVGDWDASSGSYPLADESNTTPFVTQWGAVIKQGFAFRVGYGQAGTVGGYDYENGDVVYALIDSPTNSPTDWGDLDHNLQQSTESTRGTAKITTQALIENNNTLEDETIVTPYKFWLGWAKIKTLASQVITQIWEFLGLDLTTGQAVPTYKKGRAYWDESNDCISFYDSISGTSLQIGQELVLRCRNNSGATILNGKVVYISGAIGQNPTCALAKADSATTSKVIGIATHDIANNTVGKITLLGIVNDLNTSSFTDGQEVYLSATTAGELTATAPSSPNFVVSVGYVSHAHVTQGKLTCHPQHSIATTTGTSDDFSISQKAVTDALALKQATLTDANFGTFSNGLTSKTTPVDADTVNLSDSADSNKAKKLSFANLKAFLKTYFDTLYISKSSGTITIVKDITVGSNVTNTTSITALKSVLIPANTVQVGDVVNIRSRAVKNNSTGSVSQFIYVNTSDTLTGATLVGTQTAVMRFCAMSRNLFIHSETASETLATSTSSSTDEFVASTSSGQSLNIDWTVDQYIIQAFQNNNLSNSVQSKGLFVTKL